MNKQDARVISDVYPWDLRGVVDDFGNLIHWSLMPRAWTIGAHGCFEEHLEACFDFEI